MGYILAGYKCCIVKLNTTRIWEVLRLDLATWSLRSIRLEALWTAVDAYQDLGRSESSCCDSDFSEEAVS